MNTDQVYKPTEAEFAEAIEQMKREILEDMGTVVNRRGLRMPMDIRDYSTLHDYVDANEYGGFCGPTGVEGAGSPIDRRSWWGPFEDLETGVDVVRRAQEEIHNWLRSGAAYRERVNMPARVQNENCLEGMRCPRCGFEEGFSVAVTTTVELQDGGTVGSADEEWGDDSVMECDDCEHRGAAKFFMIETQRREVKLPYLTLGGFRRATEHLPDETPITAGTPSEWMATTVTFPLSDWLNVDIEHVPEAFPHGDETSIILATRDDFDTRQW